MIEQMIENYKRDHTHPMNKATHMVGIPMILVSLPVLPFDWKLAAALFVTGWIFQFIGHAFEGKAPSFFRDPRFLLIGATWYLRQGPALIGLGAIKNSSQTEQTDLAG